MFLPTWALPICIRGYGGDGRSPPKGHRLPPASLQSYVLSLVCSAATCAPRVVARVIGAVGGPCAVHLQGDQGEGLPIGTAFAKDWAAPSFGASGHDRSVLLGFRACSGCRPRHDCSPCQRRSCMGAVSLVCTMVPPPSPIRYQVCVRGLPQSLNACGALARLVSSAAHGMLGLRSDACSNFLRGGSAISRARKASSARTIAPLTWAATGQAQHPGGQLALTAAVCG